MNSIVGKLGIAIVMMATLTGCWDQPKLFPCDNGSGVVVTESRLVSNFSKLVIDLPADVYLHRDTAFALNIEAQESLMEWITTEVSGSVLEIRNERCFRSTKTIRIDVYVPEVDYIEVLGSGDVYGQDPFSTGSLQMEIKGSGSIELEATASDASIEILGSGDAILDLTTDVLNSRITGSGDLISQGVAGTHEIRMEGSGSVEAFGLITDETSVTISGSGGAEVHANSTLIVKILGSGDVAYKGTPLLDVKISGSGEVVNAN